jgi:hypothetical protein
MPPWRDRLSSLKEGMFHANEWYFSPNLWGIVWNLLWEKTIRVAIISAEKFA